MDNLNWDEHFKEIVYAIARKSKDPSSKFGAVVVDEGNRILSTGYNGLPRGVDYESKYFERPDKYAYFVHAEQNAIFGAAYNGITLRSSTMYVISPPCAECVKAIIQAGVVEVAYYEPTKDLPPDAMLNMDNWRLTLNAAADMLRRAGVKIRRINGT